MHWKRYWTVSFCDCGGYDYCKECELPCEHDKLCPQCQGWEWFPHRVVDMIDYLIAKDMRWLYRTRRDAMATIEQ